MLLCLLASLGIALPSHAAGVEDVDMNDITVRAKKLRLYDEVDYSPHSVSIAQPASDVYLGETLSKLPGVLVRNTSGFGSVTTVITAGALGSAGTAVSIDDIPVVDSSGRGVNFSLFPSTLISGIEHYSPFYPSIDPTTVTSASPGGRINLKTLRGPHPGQSPFVGSLVLGTGHSVEGTAGYRGRDGDNEWVAGLTGYNTAGDYHFQNPLTSSSDTRMNNDAAAGGALGKYRWNLKNDAVAEVLDLGSATERTNPGSLTSPARQHQSDQFNLLGAKYAAPRAFSAHDGVFAKTAVAYARTATRGSGFATGPSGETTDSRTVGDYAQAGYTHRAAPASFALALDNQYDHLRADEGSFNRDVFGATGTMTVELGQFKVVPLARLDVSSVYANAGDGSASLIWSPDSEDDLSLSYGLTHSYPSITAVGGFSSGGIDVLPNTDLHVQRDSIAALSLDRHSAKYTLFSSVFYDLVRNRSTFSFVSDTAAQFVNQSEVSVVGYTLDGQVFPLAPLAVRGSLTLSHAWDRASGHEMPYKPRFEGWGSVSYLVLPWIGLTAQESFVGKRFVSTTGVDAVSPFAQTILRLDAQVGGGVAFFKVTNLFDAGGFENPGFPFEGRAFWLGYTIGAAAL